MNISKTLVFSLLLVSLQGFAADVQSLDQQLFTAVNMQPRISPTVQDLLDLGADPNFVNDGSMKQFPRTVGQSLLHRAADEGFLLDLKALILAGADVDAITNDYYKQTPLYKAVASGNLPEVQALINAGANPFIGDNRGMKPIDMARDQGIRTLLRERQNQIMASVKAFLQSTHPRLGVDAAIQDPALVHMIIEKIINPGK